MMNCLKQRSKGGCAPHAQRLALFLTGALGSLSVLADLDPTFGAQGLLLIPLGGHGGTALAVVQQPDGKLVLAGESGADFVVARTLSEGRLDSGFGTHGSSRVDFFGREDVARAMLLQPDGKIVVVGTAETPDGAREIALARLTENGTLDAGFGDAGKVRVDRQGNRDLVRALIQQPDGKLVVTGETSDSSGLTQQLVVRLNADGSLDSTFGTDGRVLFSTPGSVSSWSNDIELQPDGRMVVVGSALMGEGPDIAVVRLFPDGTLDAGFGAGGHRIIDAAGGDDEALSVAIQPDAKVVIAGYARLPGSDSGNPALVRLNADGGMDEDFGISGVAVAGLGGDGILNAMALEQDGKIVATGSLATDTTGPDMILTRFNADGSLDASFGRGGFEIVDYGEGYDAHVSLGTALVRQSDGKHVVAGPNSIGSFSAARFDETAHFSGRIGLTRSPWAVAETSRSIVYTVRRTGGDSGDVTVDFATVAQEAESGADFDGVLGRLTWADGDATDRTVSVSIIDDALVEPDESFRFELSAPGGGARLATDTALTTITSNDGPGRIGFLYPFDAIQPSEGDTIHVPVVRTGGSEGEVGVSYSTVGGTATAGTDFEPARGKLTWADGEQGTKSIAVRIIEDSIAENRESFGVCLSALTGGASISAFGGLQMVLIHDKDGSSGGNGGGVSGCFTGGGNGDGGNGGGNGGGGVTTLALAWLALLVLGRERARPRRISRGSARSS